MCVCVCRGLRVRTLDAKALDLAVKSVAGLAVFPGAPQQGYF